MIKFVIGLALNLLIIPCCRSELIQILHTNDIHSHLEHSIHQPELGGYGRLLSLIHKEKITANDKGIGSLVLDAGDFLEGHIYYLADKGKKTYEIHGLVGYDAVVLGNHDYLMGLLDLDSLLGSANPSFSLLCANLHAETRFKNINNKVLPYTEREINGVKIGIIGITSNDPLYKWRLNGGDISNEIKAAKKWAKVLRQRGNNLIIALTHLGLAKDLWLARNVSDLDVIVGGHSHDALKKVVWMRSKEGKNIPIVQAGKHAEWLGRLLIDYNLSQKKLKVVEYSLRPVRDIPANEKIVQLIELANFDLDYLFGMGWLSEITGKSTLRPQHLGGNEDIWMYFINDAMMDAVDSEVAVHVGALSGNNYPITGPVTHRDLYNSNPRQFEMENIKGYSIYTAQVRGLWLKLTMKIVMALGLPLYFSGITFDYISNVNSENTRINYNISNMQINGKKLECFKRYKVTLSEAIIRGSQAITPWFRFLLSFPNNWKIPMWTALETRMKKIGTITEDYLPHHYRMKVPDHSTILYPTPSFAL